MKIGDLVKPAPHWTDVLPHKKVGVIIDVRAFEIMRDDINGAEWPEEIKEFLVFWQDSNEKEFCKEEQIIPVDEKPWFHDFRVYDHNVVAHHVPRGLDTNKLFENVFGDGEDY